MQNDLLFIQNTSTDSTEYEEKFVNLTANKVVFVDTNNLPTTTGIGLSTQFLKADGSLDSTTYEPILPETPANPDNKYLNGNRLWSEISIGAGGYAGNVYASNVDSDISGYKTMSYALDSTESIRSIVVNNNTVLSETCLYDSAVGVTVIPSGLWKATFYAKVNSTIGDTTLKIQVFTRHLADGSETNLFEMASPIIENTADYAILRFEGSQIAFTVLETDRVGIRIKGSTTRTQNTTINYIIGDGRGLYITTPLQIRHSQLRDLNGDTNYLHVTSTEKSTWNNSVPYTGAVTNVDLGLNYLNADTLKLDGTELLIDAFKSGSLGGAGNIFYSTGASSQPASGTVNQVVGNNYIQNQDTYAQNANMRISGVIASSGARFHPSSGEFIPLRVFSNLKINDLWYGSLLVGKAENTYQSCQFGWVFNESNPINSFAHITPHGIIEGEIFKLTATGAATFASTIQATTAKLTNLTDGYLPLHQNDANGLVNSNIYQDVNGNVGIGTENPTQKLLVNDGNIHINTPNNSFAGNGLRFNRPGATYAGLEIATNNVVDWSMGANSSGFGIYEYGQADSTRLIIKEFGNVGIGTTEPLSKLSINGGLHVGGDSDAGDDNILADGTITGTQLISNIATGTPPLVVASTSLNTNLNADLLDGQHGSYYQTASPKIKLTPEGGYAILLTNKTGANSVKGTVVYADPAVDNAFEVNPINGDMPFGIVYESGIADGSECWVVVSGIAEVLLVNTVASTRSYVAYSSGSVAGRIDTTATVPAVTTHFREIGHTIESKAGGTDVLCKCVLHFN